MKKPGFRISLFIVAVPFIILSCGSVTSPKPGLNIVASVSQRTAESLTFRIGVENTGLKTEALRFNNSQFFDIEVKDGSGHVVWQLSYQSFFADVLWGFELAPGESEVREYVWNLTGNDQKPMHSGSYKARIYITNSPRDEELSKVISLNI